MTQKQYLFDLSLNKFNPLFMYIFSFTKGSLKFINLEKEIITKKSFYLR